MTTYPTPSLYLFDCDGVLCPPLRFARELENRFGITIQTTRPFFTREFQLALLGQVDVRDLLHRFLRDWKWPGTTDEFLQLWLESERHVDRHLLAIIRRLRGAGSLCAFGTNQERRRAAFLKQEMGLAAEFDQFFISCEVGAMKPAPEFYAAVERTSGIEPDGILFIDDSPHFLDAAKERGWMTHLFSDALDLDVALGHTAERSTDVETSARAVIIRDGALLCCVPENRSDLLFLPGGRIEQGETLQNTLERELNEELDHAFTIRTYLGKVRSKWTREAGGGLVEHHYFLVILNEVHNGSEIASRESGTELRWVPISVLHDVPLKPAGLAKLVNEYVSGSVYRWEAELVESR